jgi:hypothetical protein
MNTNEVNLMIQDCAYAGHVGEVVAGGSRVPGQLG